MGNIRASAVLNAFRFVREGWGQASHQSVLESLARDLRASLEPQPRESAWVPLVAFVEYIEAAWRTCAPREAGFFRRLGRHAGQLDRRNSGLMSMLHEPGLLVRTAPLAWRAHYDVGSLEVEALAALQLQARLLGFPARRSLCERRHGVWDTLLSGGGFDVQVVETRCRTWGDEHCEARVHFEPDRAAP